MVIPGIGGSALRSADGRPLWAFKPGVVCRPVRHVAELVSGDGNLADPDFTDGVTAYDLMAVPIPGLTRLLGGYRELRTALFRDFDLISGLTYLEFPYDWRRPVAFNAALLAKYIDERLKLVRRTFEHADVVLIGHSMGGLVGSEYIAHHGGDRIVRKLITLGTPFRGAAKALDFLVNGPKFAHVRFRSLAEALGRLPSMYELLPVYPLIRDAREPALPLRSVPDVTSVLPVLDHGRVAAAWQFLTALNESEQPMLTYSLVGYGSPTVQQAALYGTELRAERVADRLPSQYQHSSGDGTVPAVAATPRSGEFAGLLPAYQNQTHGGLVTGSDSLGALVHTLRDALRDGPVLDPGDLPAGQQPDLANRRTVSLDVADFYSRADPVRIAGHAYRWPAGRDIWYQLDGRGPRAQVIRDGDGSFEIDLGLPAEGVYRLDLLDGSAGATVLSDVVEVG